MTRRVARMFRRHGLGIEPCTCEELIAHAQSPANVALIVDPALLEPHELTVLLGSLSATPKAAIAYASLSPRGVEGALDFARHSTALVAFQNLEEDVTALARTLIGVADPAFTNGVLDGLQPRLRLLPPTIAAAAISLFLHEPVPGTPNTLARRARVARRSVDRWLDRAGIVSTRLLVLAPTMLRAITLLQQTTLSMRRVAHLAGYSVLRRMNDHAAEFTDMTPSELRTMSDPTRVVPIILERLVRAPGDAGDGAGSGATDPQLTG